MNTKKKYSNVTTPSTPTYNYKRNDIYNVKQFAPQIGNYTTTHKNGQEQTKNSF